MDSRTDMMKLTVSFHSLVVSSKNVTFMQVINIDLQTLIHFSVLNFYFISIFILSQKNAMTGLVQFRIAK